MPSEIPNYQNDEMQELSDYVKHPSRYNVFILNDDYSTFEFVVDVLMQIFNKSANEAVNITNNVHKQGKGLCGTYSKEIAETKVMQVRDMAKRDGHPLRAVLECDSD